LCLYAAARLQPPDFEHAAFLAPGTPAGYRGLFMLRQRTDPETGTRRSGIGRRQKNPAKRRGSGSPVTLKMASAQPRLILVARNGWTVQKFRTRSLVIV
jgi:hypothetical protein